uniref:Uncharacterized protein n=1 Tax=viral metagenome TaxID=1070528 RepID=A0A6M3IWI6_9ZZZZ
MRVCLNGMNFELLAETGVTRSPMQEWSEQIRTDGNQQRKDRVFISSWSIDDWSGGLGVNEVKVGSTANLKRIWDAENVDTRFDQMVLSPEFNTCTIVPSNASIQHFLQYLTELYLVTGSGANMAYKFTAPFTIGSFSHVATHPNYGNVRAVKAIGNKIGMLYYNSGEGFEYARVNRLSGVPSRTLLTPTFSHAEMAVVGGTLLAMAYDQTSKNAHFYIASDDFAAFTAVATLPTTIGSYLAEIVDDGITAYAQLPEGVYDFDNTPNQVISTSRSQDKNNVQTMYGNKLYFKNKQSLLGYDGVDIANVGYDRNDGLPSDKMGEITAMASSWKFNFAAVHGPTYSHILSYDGAAWQYYARVPSPGLWVKKMLLSDAPDAIDRLWLIYGNYQFPGYFLNPMVNPLQAATYSHVPTGHVTFPAYGGDMPEESGAYFREKYNFSGMGGSNIITAQYGLNGAAAVTTLGVVATNEYTHLFGSPYGVEASKIMPKYILAGANSGTTPIFKQAVIEYLKDPDKRSIFDFTVDIDATSQFGRTSKEAVIGSLNYALDKKTMMPFWYGQMGTRHVKVLDMPSGEEVKIQTPLEQQREGLVQVRLVEVL